MAMHRSGTECPTKMTLFLVVAPVLVQKSTRKEEKKMSTEKTRECQCALALHPFVLHSKVFQCLSSMHVHFGANTLLPASIPMEDYLHSHTYVNNNKKKVSMKFQ